MDGAILLYVGSIIPFVWGLAHLFPTRRIVMGFGEISADNKRIVAMEWITEGVCLMFIGVLVALVTYFDRTTVVSRLVFWSTFGVLNILSLVSLFTGFRNAFIAFKLCPFIFTGSSLLIVIGSLLG